MVKQTTKRKSKSWKANAIYYKQRIDELEDKIKTLQSPKNQIVENNKPEIKNSEIKNKENPEILKAKSNELIIEDKTEEKEPKETKEIKEEENIEDFKFECPECSKQFNKLNNGCCPFCDAELEEDANEY